MNQQPNPMEVGMYLFALTQIRNTLGQDFTISFTAQEMVHVFSTPDHLKDPEKWVEVSTYGLPNGEFRIVVGTDSYQQEQRSLVEEVVNAHAAEQNEADALDQIPFNQPDVVEADPDLVPHSDVDTHTTYGVDDEVVGFDAEEDEYTAPAPQTPYDDPVAIVVDGDDIGLDGALIDSEQPTLFEWTEEDEKFKE